MKTTFHLHFHTHEGQTIYLVGSTPELGSWNPALAKEMNHLGNGHWQLTLDIPCASQPLEYNYRLCANQSTVLEEWNKRHTVVFDHPTAHAYTLYDHWQMLPEDPIYYTSAFTKNIFGNHPTRKAKAIKSNRTIMIKAFVPCVKATQQVAITGNHACLGNWDSAKALKLTCINPCEWQIEFDGENIHSTIEYKLLLLDDQTNTVEWELGDNRDFTPPAPALDDVVVISGLYYRSHPTNRRYAGSVIPLFSLRSNTGFGVGDLADLHRLVDWAKQTNQHILQILPMNDTTLSNTWRDSYPYSAISIYALHPMYISLDWLGALNDQKRCKHYAEKQNELNQKETVDYEAVVKYKTAYLRDYFNEKGKQLFDTHSFNTFFANNQSWLIPYAAYSYLRDTYKSADFTTWETYAVYNPARIEKLCSKSSQAYEAVSFYYFVQYIADNQFGKVAQYARSQQVVLKGDLPIGVNRTSVEAWTEPQYFNMAGQAGAPPDHFSPIGQNWMFPTYNWEVMEKDNYAWWKKRFSKLNDYYDCFRIDHILGFFRIWEIPEDYIQGLCGHFNPARPFTKQEIEQYGLPFNEKRFTTPHIHKQHLYELFGDWADETENYYLAQSSSQHYALKPFCDTQKKSNALFADKTDENALRIKNGLFAIANDVLFLRDPLDPTRYHPRICANQSYLYNELCESDKQAFDRLYADFFYVRNNDFWKETAYKRLTPLIKSSDMLICGEDLGMIPDSVPEVMNKLNILSLEIERMPKAYGEAFTNLCRLPYLSVCTTSTHDMTPLRNWWTEEPDRIQHYYNQVLGREGRAPAVCTPEIAAEIIRNHLHSPAMLSIIPLQDWLAINHQQRREDPHAERINVPANPNHYWCYRMHLTVEELLTANTLNSQIDALIRESGRS